jgi:hypothetical protein
MKPRKPKKAKTRRVPMSSPMSVVLVVVWAF